MINNYNMINKNTELPEFPDDIDKNIPENAALYFFNKYPEIFITTKRTKRPHINKNLFQEGLGILTSEINKRCLNSIVTTENLIDIINERERVIPVLKVVKGVPQAAIIKNFSGKTNNIPIAHMVKNRAAKMMNNISMNNLNTEFSNSNFLNPQTGLPIYLPNEATKTVSSVRRPKSKTKRRSKKHIKKRRSRRDRGGRRKTRIKRKHKKRHHRRTKRRR